MGYVVAEFGKVKKEFPEFEVASEQLKNQAIARAREIWSGYEFGEMYPKEKQFGITTLLPKFLYGYSGTVLTTYRQRFGSSGWQDIFNKTIAEDIIIGAMGFAIPDPSINISELRMEISDVKFPRINIEEMRCYDKPAIIFKQGWIAEEEKAFKLRGYIETAKVYQRVIPVAGFVLYKKKDDVISE